MKRWKWTTVVIGLVLAASSARATGPNRMAWQAGTEIIDNTTYFDANSLLMFVTNTGSFAYDKTAYFGKNDGGYFPKGTNKSFIYAGGIWTGAKVDGEIRIAVAEYSNEYVPGPMKNGSSQPDIGSYRVYKIKKGDTRESNLDYRDWPFDDGAPALKNQGGQDSLDAEGNRIPLLQGEQALWAVYNDGDRGAHSNNSGSTAPLGVEIQMYAFGYARAGALGQTMFMRFTIINKGGNTLDSTFISLWSDPDLGDAGDDLVGCDTLLSLGYIYNSKSDNIYGDAPPAGGYDFFQGPIVPAPGDSAWISSRGAYIKDYRNLPMTSFNKYINGTDPANSVQTFNYMRGLSNTGEPQTDPDGVVTKFVVAGDPVAGTGWLDDKPADRRFMMTTGPFTMVPNDTQEVVAAIVVGQGVDRLSSITELKRIDRIAQSTFDMNFKIPGPPPQPTLWAIPHDGAVQLLWGPEADGNVQYGYGPIDTLTGEHPLIQTFLMEGFNIYQGTSSSGPWTNIGTFDVNDGVQRIYNDVDNPEGKERIVVQHGSDNGLTHELWVTNDRIRGGAMINDRPYYFTVTSYNYDDQNKSDFSIGPNSFGIIAESFENLAGTQVATVNPRSETGVLADTLAASDKTIHIAGNADGSVLVDFVDQNAITGDTYLVAFDPDIHWTLRDLTKGVNLLTNQSATISSKSADGMVLRILNPPPGMKDYDIPSGTRRFTSAGGAGDFGFEGFGGAIGWDCPTHFFGTSEDQCVPVAQVGTVLLKLATVDTQGHFDPNDPNVSYGYRYLRGAQNAPAKPEFAPFIKNPSGSYAFQDFAKSVPLSAWDMESNPPRRLAVGYLENNVTGGLVDGEYWPPDYNVGNNTAGSGPREWLWILRDDYTETPKSEYQGVALSDPMPVMWFITAARRGDVPFSPDSSGQDQFEILANHVITPADTFQFVTHKPGTVEGTVIANTVEKVHPVPNPYYNVSDLELDQFRRIIKFVNMPAARTTVRIFNLAGDLVRTLVKADPATSELTWDVLTENGIPVASGLYIYHVEAEGLGTKVGKLAVFTEVEQLNTY